MENNENTFTYSYSASEQEEIRRIEEKYLGKSEIENKMEQLRKLDAGVTMKATMASIIVGVIGTLLLGVGMCCCLVWTSLFVIGIIIGVIGIIILSMAYPIYKMVLNKEKEKTAPQILTLVNELKR